MINTSVAVGSGLFKEFNHLDHFNETPHDILPVLEISAYTVRMDMPPFDGDQPSASSVLADQVLVRRVQEGDAVAFNILVSKYQKRIEAVVARYVYDRHELLDVVQETFLRAYKGIDDFRGDSAFFTWLYRIATNTAKNYLQAKDRRPPDSDIDSEIAELFSLGNFKEIASPEHLLLRDEIEKKVFDLIQGLPDDLQQAITLREIEGLSYESIAELMQCPIGTVRSRISRARDIIDQGVKPLLMD